MPSITFSGVELKSVSRVPAAATLHFACELTAGVIKHLEWGELPDGSKKATMDGQLAGGTFTLTPKESKQKTIEGVRPDELSANLLTASGFVITRQQIEGTRGKGVKRRIDFVVKCADCDAAAKAEAWLCLAGDTKASLAISYSARETQAASGDDGEGDEE
jgi:hypothetical protein